MTGSSGNRNILLKGSALGLVVYFCDLFIRARLPKTGQNSIPIPFFAVVCHKVCQQLGCSY